MTIRAVNASFESQDRGDYATIEEAYRAALAGGIAIATSELMSGKAVCVVELSVDIGHRRGVMRGAVSMSTAALKPDPPANDDE